MASPQVKAVIAALEAGVMTAAKSLVLEFDRNLRATTPVKTGHARASWVPSIGAPSSVEVSGSSEAAHDAGVAQVLTAHMPATLYESTNVAYMAALNGGSSDQAPAGFIEVALQKAQDTVNARYASQRIVIDATSSVAGEDAGNLASAYTPEGLG